MRKWLGLTRVALVATTFGVSIVLMSRAIGPRSPWLGLMVMVCFTGLAWIAEPVIMLRLPRALRAVDPAWARGDLYRKLGVRAFGALLRNTPLRFLNTSVYRDGGTRSLAEVCRKVESAEAIHFWAGILFAPYIVYLALCGFAAHAALFTLVEIVFNVYPFLHLRAVRARLAGVDRSRGSRELTRRLSGESP